MSSVIKQAAPVVQDARRRVGFRARAGAVSAGAFDGAAADPARPCQMIGDRGGDEHAGVSAGDDADDHREREPVQHVAAEEEQRQGAQQRGARR